MRSSALLIPVVAFLIISCTGTAPPVGAPVPEPLVLEPQPVRPPEPEEVPAPVLQVPLRWSLDSVSPGAHFVFALAQPRIWWEAGAGEGIQLQLASREDFSSGSILFSGESKEGPLRLERGLEEDRPGFLRVRRIFADGSPGPWTPAIRVSWRPLEIPMKTVLAPGSTATFTMGNRRGQPRENPEHPVLLTRPYEMALHPLTNGVLADILNRMLEAGLTRIGEDGNLEGPEGAGYLGVKSLNYGFQFGLEFREGRLYPRREREDHPAVGLSRPGAEAVLNSLSRIFGYKPVYSDPAASAAQDREARGFRLPTEAEWEFAARGPGPALFPWGGNLMDPRRANYHRSGDPFESLLSDPSAQGGPTTPVGFYDGKRKSGFATLSGLSPAGLQDMLGNVWEWCEDFFDPDYYASSPEEDPLGPAQALEEIFYSVRGGAWNTPRGNVSPADRGWYKPEGFSYSIGLRPARSLDP